MAKRSRDFPKEKVSPKRIGGHTGKVKAGKGHRGKVRPPKRK